MTNEELKIEMLEARIDLLARQVFGTWIAKYDPECEKAYEQLKETK